MRGTARGRRRMVAERCKERRGSRFRRRYRPTSAARAGRLLDTASSYSRALSAPGPGRYGRSGRPATTRRRKSPLFATFRLRQPDAAGRPVLEEDLADQIRPRYRAPAARVAGLPAVVAHEEVHALRHAPAAVPVLHVVLPSPGLHVRLVELLPVDPDEALRVLVDAIARQADQALDEGPARAAGALREIDAVLLRRIEDDDLAPVRVAEVVDQPVREHAVGEACLAVL